MSGDAISGICYGGYCPDKKRDDELRMTNGVRVHQFMIHEN
jgi:hypothetical protein